MSNKISYIIELVDQFSDKAERIQAIMKGISAQTRVASKSFQKLETNMNKSFKAMQAKTEALQRSIDEAGLGKTLTEDTEKVEEVTKRSFKKILSSVSTFGVNLRKNVTLPLGVAMFGMLKAHQTLETLAAGFGGALGSEQKGQAFVNQLQKFGQRTPFELKDIMEAATRFVAVGEPVKKIIPDLKVMGDIAAMSGVHINDLAQELTKIKARGRMYAMDINILSTHRVNMIKLIQDHIKIAGQSQKLTVDQIRKLVSSGAITYKTVMQLLSTMTAKGGLAHKQMIIHLHTLLGATRNLKDNTYQLAASMGDVIDKSLNLDNNMLKLSKHMANITNHMKVFIASHKGVSYFIARFATFVVVLGVVLKAISMVGKIFTTVFSPMLSLAKILISTFTGVDAAAVSLGAAFGWVAVVTLAIMGIIYVCKHWKSILKEIKTLWTDIINSAKHPILTAKAISHKIEHTFQTPIPADIVGSGPQGLLFGHSNVAKSTSLITLNVNDKNNIINSVHSQHQGNVHMKVGRNMGHAE